MFAGQLLLNLLRLVCDKFGCDKTSWFAGDGDGRVDWQNRPTESDWLASCGTATRQRVDARRTKAGTWRSAALSASWGYKAVLQPRL